MAGYPVTLELAGRQVVVVGGDALAEEKVGGLLAAGASVTVVAATVTPGLAELAAAGRLRRIARAYEWGDLAGAFLAILVERAEGVELAWQESRQCGVLVNTVDDVPHCDFLAPAVVRRGDLTIAIATAGKAPALAARLRQRLEREVGEEHARFLELAGRVRAPLARHLPALAARRERWYRLVDSDVLELLRAGDEETALRRFVDILGVPVPAAGASRPVSPGPSRAQDGDQGGEETVLHRGDRTPWSRVSPAEAALAEADALLPGPLRQAGG